MKLTALLRRTSLLTVALVAACVDAEPPALGEATAELGTDRDCDGLADTLEVAHGQNPDDPADAEDDPDGDGVPSADELRLGGDPFDPDSDADGTLDGVDLVRGRDFDGDGVLSEDDVCPTAVDPDQADRDGDGTGDACDPRWTRLREARRADGNRALLPARMPDRPRLIRDLMGMFPTGDGFQVLTAARAGERTLTELYAAATRDHAYVTTPQDREALIALGYQPTGATWGLARTSLGANSRRLRRFVRDTGGHDEQVTADPATATALKQDGYRELATLGYVLADRGRLRRPVEMVRFLKVGDTETLHTTVTAPELLLSEYNPARERFRVLPEATGWTIPLYRLRLGFDELLVVDRTEVATLRAAGWTLDGVIGHGFARTGSPDTVEDLVMLVRLVAADGVHRTVVADEVAALVAAGWTVQRDVARVIRLPQRAATCTGPTPVQILAAQLRAIPDPTQRAITTLTGIATRCALQQAMYGNVTSPIEEIAASHWNTLDPELRYKVDEVSYAWFQLDGPTRAELLGPLAHLDPGYCLTPLDLDRLQTEVARLVLAGPGDAVPALREPHCTGADGDVTVDAHNPDEGFLPVTAAEPVLLGLDRQSAVRGHPSLLAWMAAHPTEPIPTAGVPALTANGQPVACDVRNACAASEGLACDIPQHTCRAYPILRAGTEHIFRGWNFWDTAQGHLEFTPLNGAAPHAFTTLQPSTPISAGRDDLLTSSCGLPLTNQGAPDLINVAPATGLVAGTWYAVQFVNRNGNFHQRGEDWLLAADAGQGRTIHVCRPGDPTCTPVDDVHGACTAEPASCGGATGGTWSVPPRPLAACLDPNAPCRETPVEFRSRGIHYVFVEAAPPTYTIETRIEAVSCLEETGWDWLGDDEVRITVGTAPEGDPTAAVTGAPFENDFDTGEVYAEAHHLAVTAQVVGGTRQIYALQVDETDYHGDLAEKAAIFVTKAVATAAAAYLGSKIPTGKGFWSWAKLGAIGGAGGGGYAFASAVLEHYLADDRIGSLAEVLRPSDVIDRSQLQHDRLFVGQPAIPMLEEIANEYLWPSAVSSHPAVDGAAFMDNRELVACTANAGCAALSATAGWTHDCVLGACVPRGWTDPTGWFAQPRRTGFVQKLAFKGTADAEYDVYVSYTITATAQP